MKSDIRIRLIQLGKKQVDLLDEIRKRGYPRLQPTQLSRYINERDTTPQATAVLKLSENILSDWEKETA